MGSLWLWGGGRWVGMSGGMGVFPHTCTCMHMHTHAHVYMYKNCKWLPTWRHPCLSDLSCLTCMCMCMHAHPCMHGTSSNTPIPTPTPIHPPITLPRGDPQNQSKFNGTYTNQDNSILFEDLKSVENSPPMGGSVIWLVSGSIGGLMGGVGSNH